jgi:MerR family transcriptional regulator, light-induced transcriptional regulator
MNPSPDTPVYNLKAVVRDTGLKPDTIRAWERRYGLPEPRRTDSGHRLYSQNDINMLKWLVARQNEGMNISRAIELWRQLAESEIDPVEARSSGPLTTLPALTPVAEPIMPAPIADNLSQLRSAWLNACLNFDEQAAERVVAQAFALFSVEVVCIDLLQRGLAQVGEGWFQGHITVQQEHFASALATRRLEALLAATPAPTRPNRILVGCPPGETHTFAPMLVTLLLRRRGWDVVFLGANIPLEDLIATMRAARPQLVVLVAQLLHTAANLLEMAQLLLGERMPLAFGGRIFAQLPELRQRIPGHYLGDHIDAVPQMVEKIMAQGRTQSALTPVSPEYQEALRYFRTRIAPIEAEIWRRLGNTGFDHEHLDKANDYMNRDLMAALTLGDLNFLRPQLEWLAELIETHYELSDQMLGRYLAAYTNAVELHTDGRGAVITDWLQQVAYADLLDEPEQAPAFEIRPLLENRKRSTAN